LRGESKQDTKRRRGGHNAATEQVAVEQSLFEYLSKVADSASGHLSPASRNQLVARLRETIANERERHGSDLHTLERILDSLGDPITLVDGEAQRDPDYQAKLSARLTQSSQAVPRISITDDLAQLIAPSTPSAGYPAPSLSSAPPGVSAGPEICLDPDPFVPDSTVETVGALAAAAAPTTVLPGLLINEPDDDGVPLSNQIQAAWLDGPRKHPQEAIAIGLFLVGALFGEWFLLLPAALVACTSKFYSGVEKWVLTVGVPIVTALTFVFGFWLDQHRLWGGRTVKGSDLLAGAASFFGPLPSAAGLLAALFLSWRLARGIIRRS
jgi:hypothetical protein